MSRHPVFFSLLALLLPLHGQPVGAADRVTVRALAELHAVWSDAHRSWLDGGYGKTAWDRDAGMLQPGRLAAHVDLRLADTLSLRTLTAINSGPDAELALLEGFLHYRPVPRGAMRWRFKFGAFHAPLSLENTKPGWSSERSSTPSLINSWLGEELRSVGAELTLDWIGRYRQSPHDLSVVAALLGFNDPAGLLLSRRGWVQHERQTGLTGEVPVPFRAPATRAAVNPFREIDDEPGFYVGGIWKYLNRIELQLHRYDNRADPDANREGTNAWHTRFYQATLRADLAADMEILGQFMTGDTTLDNRLTSLRIEADFRSAYLMLSRTIGRHTVSARYEVFDVENEPSSGVQLVEDGHVWMLSWAFRPDEEWWVNIEWLHTNADGRGRHGSSVPFDDADNQVLFTLRRYF